MLTKGSKEYKQAQELANQLQSYANTSRWNESNFFDIAFDTLGKFINAILKTNTFAAKIAETVDKSMNPYGAVVARVSSKQAWILATTAIELNIQF